MKSCKQTCMNPVGNHVGNPLGNTDGDNVGRYNGHLVLDRVMNHSENHARKPKNNNVNNTAALENRFSRLNQDINFGYNPTDKLFFNVRGTHIHISQPTQPTINYVFMDASMRYKIKKMDFSLEATNLFNIREYKIFNVSSNQFSVNRFELRNRMLIARAIFNF